MSEDNSYLNSVSEGVIGAAIEVHTTLGPGHLEKIYEQAICVEMGVRGIPYERQSEYSVVYKEREIGRSRIDLIVDDSVVVELKAVRELTPTHKSQVISYLKLSRNKLGLLLNFNHSKMIDGVERVIFTK